MIVKIKQKRNKIVINILTTKTVISVKAAIPVIMGANIGTSITSTFVSFSQMVFKQE